MDFEKLKITIENGLFPSVYPHFGGANLIITDDPNRNFHEGDIVVYSEHAGALSWLVSELKMILDSHLNSANKYEFYPRIGKLMLESISCQQDLFETMSFVVQKIKEDWSS